MRTGKDRGKLVHLVDMHVKPANITDVAREAGVSKTTVSNFLNGREARLSDETRDKIRDVAKRLRYLPSIGARRLSTKTKSFTIGAVLRHDLSYTFNTQFFSQVMKGISAAGADLGYRLIMLASTNDKDADVAYCLSLSRGIVDGFLLFEIEAHDPYINSFVANDIPFVCFGEPSATLSSNWVASDQAGGIKTAVRHLIDRGFRRIALFPGPAKLLLSARRVAGYKAALSEAEMPYDTSLICFGNEMDCRYAYAGFLAGSVDAFVIPHSHLTLFQTCLSERGMGPAHHPALILADYFPAGEFALERFGYVKNPVSEIGMTATRALVDLVQGRDPGLPRLFPTQLVVGDMS